MLKKKPIIKEVWKLPSSTKGTVSKQLKKNQHPFSFRGKKFVLETWGFQNQKTNYLGIQQMKGNQGYGAFLAVAGYRPLNKKVPGLKNKKAWSVEAGILGTAMADKNNTVTKKLVKMIQAKAIEAGVKLLVADTAFGQKSLDFNGL